ncbi:MAG: AAA family ATPase [Planctomycetes bacterium]|nr:AAA family ATPase [Planctomycetota bacterium]
MSEPFSPLLIRASAGTGKTYQLSERFIGLLKAGESPQRILATTFTRKAAGEISDRVLSRLAEAAEKGDGSSLILLAKVARNLHRLSIGTLDSFFIRIARSFALELNLPATWRIVDAIQQRRMQVDAVRAILGSEDPRTLVNLVRLLNPGEVKRGVHDQIMNVVTALHQAYREQPDPAAWQWLEERPTRPIEELRKAIEALAEMDLPTTQKGTPVAAWKKDKERTIHAAQLQDWETLLQSGIAAKMLAGEDSYSGKEITDDVAEVFEPLIIHAGNVLLNRLRDRTRATFELLKRFDGQYEKMRRSTGTMQFADVTHELAHGGERVDLDDLYYRLDGRIAHLMLDEFQDTSFEQWRVLHPMAGEILSQSGMERSFFCVGDVKQAIYGWRGGQAEIFDTLEENWPQIRTTTMDKTRRCSQPVVDTVNAVFASVATNAAVPSDYSAGAQRWASRFREHAAHDQKQPGYVCIETGPEDGRGWRAKCIDTAYAAARIKAIARDCPGRSIGVLVRTNDTVARLIYELRRGDDGIRASEEGGNPLTDSPAVSTVLSLLKLADHPGDSAAAFHVMKSPVGEMIGLHDLSESSARRIALNVRRSLMQHGYGATLDEWARRLGPSCDARDVLRLGQLVETAHQYEADATVRPGDFVRIVEGQRVADPTASDVRVVTVHQSKGLEFDIVVLPELDGSMGLSAMQSLLWAREKADEPPGRMIRYPNKTARLLDDDVRQVYDHAAGVVFGESLCVLYVAMTRARHALYMMLRPSDKDAKLTPAGIIREALSLDAAAPEATLWERGGADWHRRAKKRDDAAPGIELRTITLDLPASPHRRLLQRRSPSQMEGGTATEMAKLMQLGRGGRAYGSQAHELLEGIEWLDDAVITDEVLVKIVEKPAVRELLTRPAGAVRVLREAPFAVRDGQVMMTGLFDRLVLTEMDGQVTHAHIIDFKTDAADDVTDITEFYRPQIAAYRRAAAAMYELDPKAIRATLLFTHAGVAVEV